jgi:zinc protease
MTVLTSVPARLFAVLAVVFAYASPALAAKATEFTLRNQMKVVVVPDHRAPVVTHMVWYKTGGVDDPPGLGGIAHFFEHLMFKGTKKVPPGELSKTVARNGGQDNAFTSHDYTAYFQRIPKERLQLVMELEADRMANLDLSEENVKTEREVVREERRLRVESDPSSLAQEQMEAALYMSHPYGRPVIGWDQEIQQIGRPEALDYYQHHYAPNNAILVVVGDVEPEEVRRLADASYGMVPARELAPRWHPVVPPRLTETRMDFALPDTRLPSLTRSYHAPSYPIAQKGVAESLDVFAAILGGGATSRLYKTLVVDKKLAVAAGAGYSGSGRDAGEFSVYAYPRPGVSFDTLEKAMDEVIAGALAAPPETGEFERAKTRLVAAYVYAQDSQMAQAQDYGSSLAVGMTVADVEDWPNRIKAVTPASVLSAGKSVLVLKEAVTGRVSPKAP